MKKKFISILALLVISVASVVTLAGCGAGIKVENVKASYEAMTETLVSYDSVLNKGDESVYRNTKDYYQISYGEIVDGYIRSQDENYVELKDYYNSVFSFAMSYVDENIQVITNLLDDEVNSATKKTLKDLKDSIDDFNESVQNFVSARNRLDVYYQNYGSTASEEEKMSRLRTFKRDYVDFVDKSVQMSLSLSNSVEATGILDSVEHVRLTKNYILNKILRAYNELYILDIGTFNFKETTPTDTKTRIENVLDKLQVLMNEYSSIMLLNDSAVKELTSEELVALKDMMNKFLTEIDVYIEALDTLNVRELCVDYKNEMDEYLTHNDRAEICLERVENFVNVSLPNFLDYLDDAVRV